MVLAVAVVLVVLRRDEALDREIGRPFQQLLGRALGCCCVAELRTDLCELTTVGVDDVLRPCSCFKRLLYRSRGPSAGRGETDGKQDQGRAAAGRNAGERSRDPGCPAPPSGSLQQWRAGAFHSRSPGHDRAAERPNGFRAEATATRGEGARDRRLPGRGSRARPGSERSQAIGQHSSRDQEQIGWLTAHRNQTWSSNCLSSSFRLRTTIMARTIDFYFDFPSPYSYLAHTQLPNLAAEHGATITYHPFRILELMTIVGNRPTTIECKNKGKYAGADLQRWTKRYNVDFARNPHSKSFDFAELDRGALVAIEDGRGADYVTAVFAAIWGRPVDLSQRAALIELLDSVGFDARQLEHVSAGLNWGIPLKL